MIDFPMSFSQRNVASFLTSLPDLWQELRKSLELSVSLQRKEKDHSSDEYDSIEEDVLSGPEPEDPALAGCPREDPPLSSGDSVPKDVPEDQETEGRLPQGPDALVVLEFNPASKSKLCLMWHFFAFDVSGSKSRLKFPLVPFFFFGLFRATPTVYGGSQARG